MSALTGVLMGLLAVYLGGWYAGQWSGNFSLLLFILTLVTFAYWLAERFRFAPAREAQAQQLLAQHQARREQLAAQGITKVDTDVSGAVATLRAQPWWLDWTAGLFPVILAVFLLRSFLYEPFKIPSGSMIPTLAVGDLILVNKYTYGVRLPVLNKKVLSLNDPQRGDVMVFRYPENPAQDYIKRVVGLPGDEITFRQQRLTVNGQELPLSPLPDFYEEGSRRYEKQFTEKLGAVEHHILVDPDRLLLLPQNAQFPHAENCRYSAEGMTCRVPAGHYFMMGDNRDNSLDSRFWGFVPDENIVGRAVVVWMNFGDLGRIGAIR